MLIPLQRHLNFRWTEVAEDVSFELVQGAIWPYLGDFAAAFHGAFAGNGPVIIKGTVRAPLPPSDNLVNVESLQPIGMDDFHTNSY